MQEFIKLGKKIYRLNNPREFHRFIVFIIRCKMHEKRMKGFIEYIETKEEIKSISEKFPFVYEQPTRAFFYVKSTIDERIKLIKEHMQFMTENFKEVSKIYAGEEIKLWQKDDLQIVLKIEPGQRKEGMLSIMVKLKEQPLYQIIFWITKDKNGEWSLYIGAMQGPNMNNAKEVVKQVTKECHSYRTKNLILYATQAMSRAMGLKKIYAVTNEGYYANNHIRRDRKLKTDLNGFWEEIGGIKSKDERFYELPLKEKRKSEEEIPVRKRAVYRRRFAMLDVIDKAIEENINAIKKVR